MIPGGLGCWKVAGGRPEVPGSPVLRRRVLSGVPVRRASAGSLRRRMKGQSLQTPDPHPHTTATTTLIWDWFKNEPCGTKFNQ